MHELGGHPLDQAAVARNREAVQEVVSFLRDKAGTSLRAWLSHFDLNNDQRISRSEFINGMGRLNYIGDVCALFSDLDLDKSGELSLEEIDDVEAQIWSDFREWCARSFSSVEDMVAQLGGRQTSSEEGFTYDEFAINLKRLGGTHASAGIIFPAMDLRGVGRIKKNDLGWLEIELKRLQRKQKAKLRALAAGARRLQKMQATAAIVQEFKLFLRKKYGGFIRAWRTGLSPEGHMDLQKSQFMLGCQNAGWSTDLQLLWRAVDKDGSCRVSVDEIDCQEAEMLARFRNFIIDNFGSAAAGFQALDKGNKKWLQREDFAKGLKMHGWREPAKRLFHALQREGRKVLLMEDLTFLDSWKPLPFLCVPANVKAMEEVKEFLSSRCRNHLDAWRSLLDPDSSNRCNWHEFEAACQKIDFRGDVAGAWRALDQDLSGYITLREIDATANDSLVEFRKWADDQFGSVRSAFGVFDANSSNQVTYTEFRRGCSIYSFQVSRDLVYTLFHALDVKRNKYLTLSDVVFLDEWNIQEEEEDLFKVSCSSGKASVPKGEKGGGAESPAEGGCVGAKSPEAKAPHVPRCALVPPAKRPAKKAKADPLSPARKRSLQDPLWMYREPEPQSSAEMALSSLEAMRNGLPPLTPRVQAGAGPASPCCRGRSAPLPRVRGFPQAALQPGRKAEWPAIASVKCANADVRC